MKKLRDDLSWAMAYMDIVSALRESRQPRGEEEMTSFDERETAAESKFARDEEMMFRAHARRDRKLGLWAAGLMHKSDESAQAYADALVAAEVTAGGEAAVIAKVLKDLASTGLIRPESEITAKMQGFLAEALAEIRAGT